MCTEVKLLTLLALLPASAGAVTSYYNNYGTYEGESIQHGNSRLYYNYRGDYMGQSITTSPEVAPVRETAPSIHLAPVPGTYEGINDPGIEMIGDPE